MINFRDLVLILMKKNKIMTLGSLIEIMNKDSKRRYENEVLSLVINGSEKNIEYIYRLEEVFNLPENFLVELVDTSNIRKSSMRGEKRNGR